ncbi:hypothetical protein BC827DRAFT_367291 [Russula dissimulans]|nr:hypothetical protein BC827DRAFT_367291 [Russula dissimulans]
MRMHHYLRSWGANIRKNLNFIHRTIQQVVRYTYAVMRSKASNKVSVAQGGKCEVEKTCITCAQADSVQVAAQATRP